MIELTDKERRVLRHTLTGSSGTDEVYRNYYTADESHHSWNELSRLVLNGLMYVGKQLAGSNGRYFHCTAQGASAVGLGWQEPWPTQVAKQH